MTWYRDEQETTEKHAVGRRFCKVLGQSFLVAYLLTGDVVRAESAVIEAINIWRPGEADDESIFGITLEIVNGHFLSHCSAISDSHARTDFHIPLELHNVLELPVELRSCFVLRFLVGLSAQSCAQMLESDIIQIAECSHNAAEVFAGFGPHSTRKESIVCYGSEGGRSI